MTAEDAADAVSEVEGADLTATATDQTGVDRSDPAGCEVTGQDPSGGSEAEPGDEVMIEVDCRQTDWDNQEGDDWEAFADAYEAGFDAGCEDLFDLSPTGALYADDREYTDLDCPSAPDPADANLPTDVPDDPDAAGDELGQADGCEAAFDDNGVSVLSYGAPHYTVADCEGAGAGTKNSTATGPRPTPARTRCGPARLGGQYVVIRATEGEINCEGAAALWSAYLRHASTEGHGSSGAVEIDGWGCSSASPASRPRVGSCSARNTQFEVYEQPGK